jgi:hypothetical protein
MKNSTLKALNGISFDFEFSICTLVTKLSEYTEMINSFYRAGFRDEFCEFLYIDNTLKNNFDGYQGLNIFLRSAKGKYIIICHQDILLDFDSIDVLRLRIDELNSMDPNWAVLGNAGFENFNSKAVCISDPYGDFQRLGCFPMKCKSLDENFLVIKSEANIAASHDLIGFHLYATDLCLNANSLGWNSYVIDFHLRHKGAGTIDNLFLNSKVEFIKKHRKNRNSYAIRTTCTMLIITGSNLFNFFLNRKIFYSIKKRLDMLSKASRRLFHN